MGCEFAFALSFFIPYIGMPLKKYYAERNAITGQEAIALCRNLHAAIIKPAIDSWCGLNVCKCSVSNGGVDMGGISAGELFRWYGRGFIIQEVITQHPVLASLNPTSVNTVRIMTYRWLSGEVVALSSLVRVGRSGEIVDNGHAGGLVGRSAERYIRTNHPV